MEIDIDECTPEYEAPTVVDYGSLRELTAGHTVGVKLDATFPNGFPVSELTLS